MQRDARSSRPVYQNHIQITIVESVDGAADVHLFLRALDDSSKGRLPGGIGDVITTLTIGKLQAHAAATDLTHIETRIAEPGVQQINRIQRHIRQVIDQIDDLSHAVLVCFLLCRSESRKIQNGKSLQGGCSILGLHDRVDIHLLILSRLTGIAATLGRTKIILRHLADRYNTHALDHIAQQIFDRRRTNMRRHDVTSTIG
ncbi:MAG: hypothetical protein DDT34_02257 [Firmicutes bacterium]|nr:hypothetical protein [Bacillota bacterium]